MIAHSSMVLEVDRLEPLLEFVILERGRTIDAYAGDRCAEALLGDFPYCGPISPHARRLH